MQRMVLPPGWKRLLERGGLGRLVQRRCLQDPVLTWMQNRGGTPCDVGSFEVQP